MFSIRTLLLVAAACFLTGGTLGSCTASRIAKGDMEAHLKQDALDLAAAVKAAREKERAQVDLGQATGAAAAKADQVIVYRTITRIKEVPTYVTAQADARGCIPWGVVRVLDAAAQGLDPADLPTPAGQPDDACSDVAPSALAAGIAENYGIAQQNAAQLDALISDVRSRAALINGPQP